MWGKVVLAAMLLLMGVLAGCQKAPPAYESKCTPSPSAAPPAPAIPVAIIGDSYTRGTEMGGRGARRWPALAAAQLSHQGVNIKPVIGADRGSGYVERGSKGTAFADQIPTALVPDDCLVVLFGSINDGSAPAPELAAAVERTLADVKAAAPQAKLLVIGPPWTNANPPARILGVRDVVKSQAEAIGAKFVDPIAEGWLVGRPELIGSDGVHPTDAGHQYMAGKIAPLIAQQLRSAPTP